MDDRCCVYECGKKAKEKDKYCSMHRARLRRTGSLNKKTPFDRMMKRIVLKEKWNLMSCWEYIGYGRLRANGKKVLAHRLSWKEHRGEIPKGLLVLHKCDNSCCVNPWHLFLGTQQDNIDNMVKKGRNRKGKDHHCYGKFGKEHPAHKSNRIAS